MPSKEGDIRFNSDWRNFKNKVGKWFMFLDNNILAYKDHLTVLKDIVDSKLIIDFNQAMDIRLLTEDNAKMLSLIRWNTFIRFSFDWVYLDNSIIKGIKLLNKLGIPLYKIFIYVLIGYNTTEEEDVYRIELLRSLGTIPFAMPYNKFDRYQKDFSRYVNNKKIFKTFTWEYYKNNKYKINNRKLINSDLII